MTDELIVLHDGPVTRLTLNRPEKANALSPGLTEALIAAFEAAEQDGTRLMVLSGAGKGFCSGFDLSGFDDLRDGDLVLRIIRIETMLQIVYHVPFPTLALGHGRIMGGAPICSPPVASVSPRRTPVFGCRVWLLALCWARGGWPRGSGRMQRGRYKTPPAFSVRRKHWRWALPPARPNNRAGRN